MSDAPRYFLREGSRFSLLVAVLATLTAYIAATALARNIEEALVQSEFEVRDVTQFVLSIPMWLSGIVALVVVVGLVIKEALVENALVRRRINDAVTALMLLVTLWTAFALFRSLVVLPVRLISSE